MYLECDKCGYTVDAKPYHEGLSCPKCKKGVMKEMTQTAERKPMSFSRGLKWDLMKFIDFLTLLALAESTIFFILLIVSLMLNWLYEPNYYIKIGEIIFLTILSLVSLISFFYRFKEYLK